MGFSDIAGLTGAGIGAIKQADAAGDAEKAQKAAEAKAVSDAANLVAQQKAEKAQKDRLAGAYNGLAAFSAKSLGASSTQFTGKLGLPAGAV